VNGCRPEQNSTTGLETFLGGNGSSVDVIVENCVISRGGMGSNADGNAPLVRVSNSSITYNTTGIAYSGTGQVISRVNNTLEKNTTGTLSSVTLIVRNKID
jgi:hypothetical protein